MKKRKKEWFNLVMQTASVGSILGYLCEIKGYELYFPAIKLNMTDIGSLILGVAICISVLFFTNTNRFLEKSFPGFLTGIFLSSELLLVMLYAQYHPLLIAVYMAAFIILSIAFNLLVKHVNLEKRQDSKALRKWCRERCNSLAAYFLCIALILPAGLGAYYEYYRESLSEETWSDFSEWFDESKTETEKEIYPYADKIKGLCEWDELSLSEKERIIRCVAMIEKEHLGIADNVEIEVHTEKMSEYICGYYKDTTKDIYINYEYLNESEVLDVLITVLHEMHHAFVYYTIDTLDYTSDIVKESYYYQSAREWKENTQNYISGSENFEAYKSQPIESDARDYSYQRIYYYYNFINQDY